MATTLADVKADAPLHALAYTIAEVEAENLYETLSNKEAETLVELLHDMQAKGGCQNNWRHTERSENQGLARYGTLHPNLGGGWGSSQHGGCHVSINKGRDTRRQWKGWTPRHWLTHWLTRYQR